MFLKEGWEKSPVEQMFCVIYRRQIVMKCTTQFNDNIMYVYQYSLLLVILSLVFKTTIVLVG